MERVITYNITEDFIPNLAGFIEENFLKQGRDISRLAFVFGGKRPALFLKRELARRIKNGFFSPRFFSIDEFVEYTLSQKESFSKLSDLEASFIIYKLAEELSPDILKGREAFSQFLPWAKEIISFIEQLDLEDINLESLENIQFKAVIGYDVPQNINVLLTSIISLREAYHTSLKKKNIYSRGFMYLVASRNIEDIELSEFEAVFFCGFFYLHKTEENIIKTLYGAKKALLFFQGDGRDWTVLERLSQELSAPIKASKHPGTKFNLYVQSGFDVHSQACLVRQIIRRTDGLDKTAIVLPVPDNIIPLLSEISPYVDDFNVSMGYPLKRSALYSLFECMFKAQATKKNDAYYTRDYLKVLSHPIVKNLKVLDNPSITRVLVHKIEEILTGIEKTSLGGSLFIKLSDIQNSKELYTLALATMENMEIRTNWNDLRNTLKQLHHLLFISWENIGNFHDFSLNLEEFLDFLVKRSFLGRYPLNLKMAERIFAIIEELKHSSFSQEPFPQEELFKIFENKLDNEMLSFSGSPLKGLQILGLLETRSLNFENVIVMDVNEASLPKLKIYEPLIPREVMINLGLNRLEKEEEIQRYQFKRLLSSAKNVYLLYQNREDKEKSRFIEELIWERQKQLNSLKALAIPRASFKVKVLPKRVEIEKKPEVIKFLKAHEYSASSINTYMHCPLRFYYQYVLGLEEKEDLLDEPEGQDIGTFIHELLKETFSKFIGKKPYIDTRFEGEFQTALDKKFAGEFQNKMKSDAFLIKEILDFRLKRFLDNEREREVEAIFCLEKTFKGKIKLNAGTFKFKAIIDRIDRLSDEGILVLDYKTGSSDIMPEDAGKIESAGFSRQILKNTIKSFQLPLYLYLIDNDKEFKDSRTNAALYFIKELERNSGLTRLFSEEESADKEKARSVYLGALGAIFQDILDPAITFKADEEDMHQCANCPFFYLCR